MASFDFISDKKFRTSLEADYKEMTDGIAAGSWKSVQVMAGSVVETVLIDYLVSTPNPSRIKKDPLTMMLDEAIKVCKAEEVLSDRTSDLCSVIRSYRNLIHPGRMVRMNEAAPNKDSAVIALTLVHMIAEELSASRRKVAGLTGEQIISKVDKDENSVPIMKHLLSEVSEFECERLLLELIPDAHMQAWYVGGSYNDPSESDAKASRMSTLFRLTFDRVSDSIRGRVAAKFVRLIREESGETVSWYRQAFFLPTDLQFVDGGQRKIVKQYILGQVVPSHTPESIVSVKGILPYLDGDEIPEWVDPFVRAVTGPNVKDNFAKKVSYLFSDEFKGTSDALQEIVKKRLEHWKKRFNLVDQVEKTAAVQFLIDVIEIPF